METGSFCVDVRSAELMKDDLDPSKILEGSPEVSSLLLSQKENVVRGIWQCTTGTVTDVEENEMFTIISGRATVIIENGRTLEISPGYVGFFEKGAKTTWIIHETLRKTFQITFEDNDN